MKNIDIVIVKPGSQKQLYGRLSSFDLTAIEPPLWGAVLSGYLRDLNYSVQMIDAEAEKLDYKAAADKIIDADPLLALMMVSGTNPSASTMNMAGAANILSLVRQGNSSIKTMIAGLHPSALPQQTITELDIDFLCQGEGFYTLPDIIDALKNNSNNFSIHGLWYIEGGKIFSNPPSPLLKNLDTLPQPAWDLLPMHRYRAHNWHCFNDIENRQPYGIIYTSLGCPFHCSFCCINALFGKNMIRYRGLETVIKEIDFLVDTYGISNIKIIDEMFALNEKRVVKFCEMIIERGYQLNMWAYARVNTVTERMLSKMKEAGINWVAYGFESGSEKVIKEVSKGYNLKMVEKVVQTTQKLGIHICGNYIFGLPEDDFDTMNQTLMLMIDINAEWANIYSAMAFPGSKLYEMALKKGLNLPIQWEGFSQYAYECQPLSTNYLSGGQVLAFRDYAFDTYYKNPRYLNMIKNKFGEKTMMHIRRMTNNHLKRKFSCI